MKIVIIDRKLDITPIYINRKLKEGIITFNKFECIPNNGKVISTYFLDFQIKNSIPKYG